METWPYITLRKTFLQDCSVPPDASRKRPYRFLAGAIKCKCLRVGRGVGRGMVRGIKVLPFDISINPFLFILSHFQSLPCPVSPNLEHSFSISLEVNFHSLIRAGVCALSCWHSICGSGEGNQQFTYIHFLKKIFYWSILDLQCCINFRHIHTLSSCFFILSFPLHPLGTSKSESFPGSLGVNWLSSHQCPPEVIVSST